MSCKGKLTSLLSVLSCWNGQDILRQETKSSPMQGSWEDRFQDSPKSDKWKNMEMGGRNYEPKELVSRLWQHCVVPHPVCGVGS